MQIEYDCYAKWGFRENPFQPSPLHPDSRGEHLLVGRDEELNHVKLRLHKHGKITCVEGPVGIGKTSLVNIAAFQCLNKHVSNGTGQLLIPCKQAFQLTARDNVDEFCTKVFLEVAQTLLEKAKEIRGLGIEMSNHQVLDAWLNSPQISNVQMGLKAYIEITKTTQTNNSSGFNATGFEKIVKEWLHEIFPAYGTGGIVCIIDNMELLETGPKAKKILEGLRDRLFNIEGLRWVFCGANGIVSSVIASPRLSGYLNRPVLMVESVHGSMIPEILKRRVEAFSIDGKDNYLPLLAVDLQRLYWIINFNLRDLLAHADDYCMYIFENGIYPESDLDKKKKFQNWLVKQTEEQYQTLAKHISRDAWELLDTAMSEDLQGNFGPGDFPFFKKNSFRTIEHKTFLQYMRKFEDLGIVALTINDSEGDEKKRSMYSVTSKGALVHYARHINNETRTLATSWLRRTSGIHG